ncbi:MAG: FHA domain-containing protein [Planctomycetia bacterium]|nr:FHA domain-containing protein [Planctomycetia bacterium]
MYIRLEVLNCKTDQQEVELLLPVTLGRGERSDLVIAHPEVSRSHCRLFEYRGMVYLQDMRSLNGTYLGGKRLSSQEVQLLPGDKFTLGPITFMIDYHLERSTGSSRGTPRPVSHTGSSMERKVLHGSSHGMETFSDVKTIRAGHE